MPWSAKPPILLNGVRIMLEHCYFSGLSNLSARIQQSIILISVFGGGEHKEWGVRECWQEASFSIFALRVYPLFINLLRTSIMSLDKLLGYLVRKTGVAKWVKRVWRRLLQRHKSQASV